MFVCIDQHIGCSLVLDRLEIHFHLLGVVLNYLRLPTVVVVQGSLTSHLLNTLVVEL